MLPGALSAYRYIALKNHDDGTGPLASYFKGEDLLCSHDKDKENTKANFFEANMYLAEDRILCWELVSKRNDNWVLKFVKLATGETDVPETIAEFLSQRRRWINGAFLLLCTPCITLEKYGRLTIRMLENFGYMSNSFINWYHYCFHFFFE